MLSAKPYPLFEMKYLTLSIVLSFVLFSCDSLPGEETNQESASAEASKKTDVYQRRLRSDFFYRFYEPSTEPVAVASTSDNPVAEVAIVNQIEDKANDAAVNDAEFLAYLAQYNSYGATNHVRRAAAAALLYRYQKSTNPFSAGFSQPDVVEAFRLLASIPYADPVLLVPVYKTIKRNLTTVEVSGFVSTYTVMTERIRNTYVKKQNQLKSIKSSLKTDEGKSQLEIEEVKIQTTLSQLPAIEAVLVAKE